MICFETRKNFSRMCIARLQKVTSYCHQMSLAGDEAMTGGHMSHIWRGPGPDGSCTARSNASWIRVTWGSPPDPNDRQTPSRNFVGRRYFKVGVCL